MPETKQEGIKWVDPVIDRYNKEVFMTCIIDGYCWKVDESGKTYCAGRYKPPEIKQDVENGVAKIDNGVKLSGAKPLTIKTERIMQHKKRGRPLKIGEVHRVTKWRREKQVVLL